MKAVRAGNAAKEPVMVESKVKASTAASAVAGLALWALGRYVFKGAVPDVVASWIYVAVPGVLAFGAGYLARHTPRPADAAPAPPAARGGYPAGGTPVSELPPPPPSVAVPEPPAPPAA